MTTGNRVIVESAGAFIRLIEHPASLAGTFDPVAGVGEVVFSTKAAAQAARSEL